MYDYIIIIGVPFAVIIVITFFTYILGVAIPKALALGIFLSLISIIAIHPYHFIENKLKPEIGNMYVSIYIIIGLLIFLILLCYNICKDRTNFCCGHNEKSFNYDDIIDRFYYENVLDSENKINPYLGIDKNDTKMEIDDIIEVDNTSSLTSESESVSLGLSPGFKNYSIDGIIIPNSIKKEKSNNISIKKGSISTIYSEAEFLNPVEKMKSQSMPNNIRYLYLSSDDDNIT